jgi:hypothetical protein
MSTRRMDGPFAVLPYEVMDILDNFSPYADRLYRNLLRLKNKVDTDQPGDWAIGTTINKVNKLYLARKSKMSKWKCYNLWQELIDSGLIKENDDGSITIMMLYKKKKGKEKENNAMSDIKRLIKMNSQITEQIISRMAELENFENIEEKEPDAPELFDAKSEKKVDVVHPFPILTDQKIDEMDVPATFFDDDNTKVDVPATFSEKKVDVPATSFDEMDVQHPKNSKKVVGTSNRSLDLNRSQISLSLISLFYSTIGQTKISKEKRERALKSYEEMRKVGFTDDQIEFAIKWIPENAKEKPYDFAIVPNMIGQALAAREEYEGKERRKAEKEAEIQAEKSRQEEENRKSAEYAEKCRLVKEKMTPDERNELKEKAIKSLENKGNKRQFINEILIEIEENRILMGWDKCFDQE